MRKFSHLSVLAYLLISLPLMAADVDRNAQAIAERARLTKPRVGVVLLNLQDARLKPALPVLSQDLSRLYFTQSFRSGSCYGQDLWEYRLDRKSVGQEDQLRKIPHSFPCVAEIKVEGNFVLVRTLNEQKFSQWQRLTPDHQLAPALNLNDPSFPKSQWRFQQDLFRDLPGAPVVLDPSTWLTFFAKGTDLTAIMGAVDQPTQTQLLRLSLSEANSEKMPEVSPIANTPAAWGDTDPGKVVWRDFLMTNYRWLIATYTGRTEDDMSGFFIVDADSGVIKARYGSSHPLQGVDPWATTTTSAWAARVLDYSALTPRGFLFVDQTNRLGSEFRAVSYHSPFLKDTTEAFTRVTQLPYEEITGISSAQEGMLVAFGSDYVIAWFGEKNPFKEKDYRTRRPDLVDMSREEYLKLIGELK